MDILYALQQIRMPLLDVFFKAITILGEQYCIMILLCCIMWCFDKRLAYKLGFSFSIGMLVNQFLKVLFCVPRPWVLDKRIIPSDYAIEGATGYSFPSGHTQIASVAYGTFFVDSKKYWIKAICLFGIICVAFSRMYYGVHTLYDVLTSIVIGLITVYLVDRVYCVLEKHDFAVFVSGIILSLALTFFTIYKQYPEYHILDNSYDGIKLSGAIMGFIVGWFTERRYVKYLPNKGIKANVIKIVSGLLILILLKLSFKVLLPEAYFFMYIQNCILILWCVLVYPYIMKKLRV